MPEHDETEEIRARAFWSGTISFGLVSVPVDLYAANRPRAVSLRMLDEDGTPLARRYYCPEHDEEVGPDEIIRGYEIEKGKFITVTDEELEGLEPRKSRDIDLRLFAPADQIDPFHFERAYFLAPAGESAKAYRLLAQTMEETGRAGIATFVMRDREYLIAILAENGLLRAETLRFQDEIRSPDDVGLPADPDGASAADVRKVEKDVQKLIEKAIDPNEMRDEFAQRLLELVGRKLAEAEDVVASVPAEPEEEESVIDLMELLKERMQASTEREPAKRTAKRAGGKGRGDGKKASRAGARSGSSGNGRRDNLDSASKSDLYERAKELDIPGRSGMSRDELIEAIRAAS